MDISEIELAGFSNYSSSSFIAFESIDFRGKTLKEWEELLFMPEIPESINAVDLRIYNSKFTHNLQVVMNNLAHAKSCYKMSEMRYKKDFLLAKSNIIADFKSKNPSSRPMSVDTLETKASEVCIDSYVSMEIAEMFLLFWQSQYDKLKLIDSRLSGIGYLIGLEARNTNIQV